MNDTAPEIDERFRAMLMVRTGEERLIMGCAMRDSARMIRRRRCRRFAKVSFSAFTGMSSMPTPAPKSSLP